MIKEILCVFLGFSSGVVISGAVFAFIAIIGVVPRLAQKTKTGQYIKIYEEALIAGGIFGTSTMIFQYRLPIGKPAVIFVSLCTGVFYGCMAVCLAEILDVIPILTRRIKVERGMFWFILALAVGKSFGSLLYYTVSGFFGTN